MRYAFHVFLSAPQVCPVVKAMLHREIEKSHFANLGSCEQLLTKSVARSSIIASTRSKIGQIDAKLLFQTTNRNCILRQFLHPKVHDQGSLRIRQGHRNFTICLVLPTASVHNSLPLNGAHPWANYAYLQSCCQSGFRASAGVWKIQAPSFA